MNVYYISVDYVINKIFLYIKMDIDMKKYFQELYTLNEGNLELCYKELKQADNYRKYKTLFKNWYT